MMVENTESRSVWYGTRQKQDLDNMNDVHPHYLYSLFPSFNSPAVKTIYEIQ